MAYRTGTGNPTRSRGDFPWPLFILGAIFLAVGLGLSWWNWTQYTEASDSEDWPYVIGKVTSSEIVERRDDEDATTWGPEIHFQYEVDGVEYTSERITVAGTVFTSNRNNGRDLVDKYPAGSAPRAFYNPDRPERAALERGVAASQSSFYLLGGLGALFTLIGLAAGIGGIIVVIRGR